MKFYTMAFDNILMIKRNAQLLFLLCFVSEWFRSGRGCKVVVNYFYHFQENIKKEIRKQGRDKTR